MTLDIILWVFLLWAGVMFWDSLDDVRLREPAEQAKDTSGCSEVWRLALGKLAKPN